MPSYEDLSLIEKLAELLGDVEHCTMMAASDTEYYEDYLDSYPGHDTPDERESVEGQKHSIMGGEEFVKLFRQYIKENHGKVWERMMNDA